MSRQILLGSSANTNLSTSASQGIPWWGQGAPQATGLAVPIPTAATVRNMRIVLSAAPGGTATRTFTMFKNGSSTSFVCTFGSADTDITESSNPVSCSAGDYLELRSTLTSTPAAALLFISVELEPTSSTVQVLLGASRVNTASSIRQALGAGFDNQNSNTIGVVQQVVPLAATLTAFYCHASGNPGSGGGGFEPIIELNGSTVAASALTMHNTTTDANVTGMTQALAVNDLINVSTGRTATANNILLGYGVLYTPTTTGLSMILGQSGANLNTGAVAYNGYADGGNTWNTTAGTFKVLSGPTSWNASGLAVNLGGAPGAARSYQFDVYSGGALNETVTISGNAQTANQDTTHIDSISNGMYLEIRCTPAGTPNAQLPRWSIIQNGGLDLALTGVSATGDVGTLGVAHDNALSGIEATGAVGTLTAAGTVALTGVSGTGAVGTLSPIISISLSGVEATGEVGILTPVITPGNLFYGFVRVRINGQTITLAATLEADADTTTGGVWILARDGVTYAIVLVPVDDPNASPVHVRTETGVWAARLYP